MTDSILRLVDATKRYGDREVLNQVSLDFERGSTSVILGPSGSGKTTVLRAIALLTPLDAGYIEMNGALHGYVQCGTGYRALPERRLSHHRRGVGMVFQQFNLFPHLTARENIALSLRKVAAQGRKTADDTAMQLLERVGLKNKADARPSEMSGGQQQRVAIARALALQPDIMLFDEPTSALDPEMVSEVLDVMIELASNGMSMIVVSHEMGFARKVAHDVIFMDDAKVLTRGTPEEVFDQSTIPRVRDFMAKIL
jgi:ABC-type polar amino acid transport system, ATPase component